MSPGWGGGGALTLVLGIHCKTDSWSSGCRVDKRGLSQTQELSEGVLLEGEFPVGAVVVSLGSPRKVSWIIYSVLATVMRVKAVLHYAFSLCCIGN